MFRLSQRQQWTFELFTFLLEFHIFLSLCSCKKPRQQQNLCCFNNFLPNWFLPPWWCSCLLQVFPQSCSHHGRFPVGASSRAMLSAHGLCGSNWSGCGVQCRASSHLGCFLCQPAGRQSTHLLQGSPRRSRVPQMSHQGDRLTWSLLFTTCNGSVSLL